MRLLSLCALLACVYGGLACRRHKGWFPCERNSCCKPITRGPNKGAQIRCGRGITDPCKIVKPCFDGSTTSPAGRAIAAAARAEVGSEKWSYAGSHSRNSWPFKKQGGANKNKCNLFVAEMLEAADIDVPQITSLYFSPIGANEWANADSKYVADTGCWEAVEGCARLGDVVAIEYPGSGHVGIVSGDKLTTSANARDPIAGKIGTTPFGFREGERSVFWRYTC